MQIKLNDKPFEITVSSVTTLRAILDQAHLQIPDNAIVTDVLLNGKPLEDNWMQQQDSIYVMEEDKLELHSRLAQELGAEAFAASRTQFEMVRADFERIAEMFRMDDEATANAHLARAVDNLQAYFRVIQESLILMGRSFSSLSIDNMPAPQFIEQFGAKLTELINTQQSQDWVLLADIIEYELVPLLKQVDTIYH